MVLDFIDRLKCLISDTRKKIAEIAADLCITQQTLYNYLDGKTLPKYRELILLADYFNCSIDYMVGREHEKETKFKKCPPFSQSLKEVFKTHGTSESKIHKKVKISRSRFYAWLAGKSRPTLNNLIKLADYFGCTIDFLVGRES